MIEGGGACDTIDGAVLVEGFVCVDAAVCSDACSGADDGAGAWKSANAGAAMATSEGAGERGLSGSGAWVC
jgi:hypothetical protein